MYDATYRINTERIINERKDYIDHAVEKEYNDPVVLPGGRDEPVIEVKIDRLSCDAFYIVAAVQIDGTLTPLLSRVVEADVQLISVLIYSIA